MLPNNIAVLIVPDPTCVASTCRLPSSLLGLSTVGPDDRVDGNATVTIAPEILEQGTSCDIWRILIPEVRCKLVLFFPPCSRVTASQLLDTRCCEGAGLQSLLNIGWFCVAIVSLQLTCADMEQYGCDCTNCSRCEATTTTTTVTTGPTTTSSTSASTTTTILVEDSSTSLHPSSCAILIAAILSWGGLGGRE